MVQINPEELAEVSKLIGQQGVQIIVAQRQTLATDGDVFWNLQESRSITVDGFPLTSAAVGTGALSKADQQGGSQEEKQKRKEDVNQPSIT